MQFDYQRNRQRPHYETATTAYASLLPKIKSKYDLKMQKYITIKQVIDALIPQHLFVSCETLDTSSLQKLQDNAP